LDSDKQKYTNPSEGTIFSKKYYFHLLSPLKGKTVLEIACGDGIDACIAAHNGAEVYAYDVSPVAVEMTKQRATVNGLSDRVHAAVYAEIEEAFPGKQFDAVMGYAALHHLSLPGFGDKVHSRLNTGGGSGICRAGHQQSGSAKDTKSHPVPPKRGIRRPNASER